jgi:hypothetical protein
MTKKKTNVQEHNVPVTPDNENIEKGLINDEKNSFETNETIKENFNVKEENDMDKSPKVSVLSDDVLQNQTISQPQILNENSEDKIQKDLAIDEAVVDDSENFEEDVFSESEDENENFSPDLNPADHEKKREDYSKLSEEELVKVLREFIELHPVEEYLHDVDIIKTTFYKKHKAHIEKIKAKFIEDGGNIEDFKPAEDPLELELKELINRFKQLKVEYNKKLEIQKEENLKAKYQIIEEIKNLINGTESINKTFQEFRELQRRWREIGLVPQQNVKDLWETYHLYVEKFYDFIKINKELRDLDLKKNLDEKIKLCERAEDLLLEPSIIKAFQELQNLHNQWREIGPVARENKEEIWQRFKTATSKINKKYQEHFEELKNTQKKNYEAKLALCEKIEEINNTVLSSHKEWEQKSNEVKELQKVWKTIGFAPKKYNNKIYQRFRNACDQFFAKMREFYNENKEAQNNNLQIKLDLCIQAEALKDSTDWKKTTEDLIQLQKKWKEVGPVPRKQSDEVWKRFRAACDYFFQRKQQYFANIDNEYVENLKKKEDLIKEIKEFKLTDNEQENIKILKDFQRRWAEIGFVPLKDKERIHNEYRDALNIHFDKLEIDDNKKKILKFKNKIEELKQNPKALTRLKNEREKYITKLKKLENNINLWENNIGFFSKSKNAQAMIDEVKQKIEEAKNEIKLLEEKINIIDNL